MPARAQSSHRPPAPAPMGWLCERLRVRGKNYRRELRASQRELTEEAIHESRVAARRLRAALELLSVLTPAVATGKARRELKRHLGLLAPLRDAQVQLALLARLRLPATVKPAFREFLVHRAFAAERAARRQVSKLDGVRVAAAVKAFVRRGGRGKADGRDFLPAALAETGRLHARVCWLRSRASAAEPDSIHRTRVAFKRFRYCVELVAPLLGSFPPEQVARLRAYQALMGAVQDACVTRMWFEEFAGGATLPAEELARARQVLEARCERAMRRYFKQADVVRDFWPPEAECFSRTQPPSQRP